MIYFYVRPPSQLDLDDLDFFDFLRSVTGTIEEQADWCENIMSEYTVCTKVHFSVDLQLTFLNEVNKSNDSSYLKTSGFTDARRCCELSGKYFTSEM